MKTTSLHHEILLFTGTSLTGKQLTSTEKTNSDKAYSTIEELEKACWNGILFEMFPEILGTGYPKCESFLWHVLNGKNYLHISIGPNPIMMDHETSIDPYLYTMTVSGN